MMDRSGEKREFLTTCTAENFAIVIDFPENKYERYQIAAVAVSCVFFLATITLNGISIVTLRKSSQLKSKVCYFVILLQSVVDLGVGVLGIPLFIYYLISPFLHHANCLLVTLALRITLLTCGFSIITQSAMTLERYIGVLHPYYYKIGVTKKRILMFVCASSVIYCAVVAYSLQYSTIIRIVLTGMIVIFLIFVAVAYTRIYLVIRQLVRSERRPACEPNGNENAANRQINRESKHAKSCFLVVITFVFLLIPATLAPTFYSQGYVDFIAYVNWSLIPLILNSSINSVIFFWTKTLLRKEAAKTLKSLCFQ